MSDYIKASWDFHHYGTNVADDPQTLPFGKWRYFHNVIANIRGQVTTRPGKTDMSDTALSDGTAIRTITFVNDTIAGYSCYFIVNGSGKLYGSVDESTALAEDTPPLDWSLISSSWDTSAFRSMVTLASGLNNNVWTYISDDTKAAKVRITGAGAFEELNWGLGTPPDDLVYVKDSTSVPSSPLLTPSTRYRYAYSYYNSTTGVESAAIIPSTSGEFTTPASSLKGNAVRWDDGAGNYTDDSSIPDGVDAIRLYRWSDTVPSWRRIVELSWDGTDLGTETGYWGQSETGFDIGTSISGGPPSGYYIFIDNQPDSNVATGIELTTGLVDPLETSNYVISAGQPFVTRNSSGSYVQGTPLPYVWGPYFGYVLACGDPVNPGVLYWTDKFNPDLHPVANYLPVSGSGDPLQGGFVWNGRPYVFSKSALYQLTPSLTQQQFTASKTACGRGLHSPNAFAIGPYIYFLASDGIYASAGGAEISLTDAELAPLFRGTTVGSMVGVDLSNNSHALEFYDNKLYFRYVGVDTNTHCLVYDTVRGTWDDWSNIADSNFYYAQRVGEKKLIFADTNTITILDDTVVQDKTSNISCEIDTGYLTLGSPLTNKQFHQMALDVDPNGVQVTLVAKKDFGATTISTLTSGTGSSRLLKFDNLGDTISRNIQFILTWNDDTAAPIIYGLHLWYRPDVPNTTRYQVTGVTHGIQGWQIVQGAYITYASDGTIDLIQTIDGTDHTYSAALASTSGAKRKVWVPFDPIKGKLFDYELVANTATYFRLYPEQCEVHVKPWIGNLGWAIVNPFGGQEPIGDQLDPAAGLTQSQSPRLGVGGEATPSPSDAGSLIDATQQFDF